jgi:hypothetical protein
LLPSLNFTVSFASGAVLSLSRTSTGIEGARFSSLPPRTSFAIPVMLVTSPTGACANAVAHREIKVKVSAKMAMSRVGICMCVSCLFSNLESHESKQLSNAWRLACVHEDVDPAVSS